MYSYKFYRVILDLRLLFNDYKQAYDSINRTHLHKILKSGIPKKLVNLIKMILQDLNKKVKNKGQMTKAFGIERGLRQVMHSLHHCSVLYWRR
jgi:hypothetical protein